MLTDRTAVRFSGADWLVAVPLGFYLIQGIMVGSCFQVKNIDQTDPDDPTRWSCDAGSAGAWGSFLAQAPLSVAWWCNCLGVLTTCLIMTVAIFASDWEQLSKDAQAELVEEDEQLTASGSARTRSEDRAVAHWTRSTMEDVLNSGPKLLGRTFSAQERGVLESGEHWVGSVAEDNHDDDDTASTDRTWPRPRSNRHGSNGSDRNFRQTAPERNQRDA